MPRPYPSLNGLSGILLLWLVVGMGIPAMADEPLRLLLIGQGPDGHPPETHEFAAGLRVIEASLASVEGLEIQREVAVEPWTAGPEMIRQADGVLLYLSQGARWMQTDPRRHAALAELAQRGGGLAALHWAIGAKDPLYIAPFVELLGACHGGPDRKYRVLEADVEVAAADHPATAGLPSSFRARDEFYYQLKLAPGAQIEPLLRVVIDDHPYMVAWAWQRPDGGRSLGFSGLHFHDNWTHEAYRRFVAQGVLWTLGRSLPEEGLDVAVDPAVLKLN